MTFHGPSVWWLLLLVLTPLVWWRWWSPRRRPAVSFSSLEPAQRAGRTWAARARWVVPALRTLAVALLIVCIARPQKPNEQTRVFTEGIAIELVVDRSGSMRAADYVIGGRPASRLEVVKQVVEQFVTGGGDLPGRPDDLVGLIAFATNADSRCPLTLDHDHLIETVRPLEPAVERAESQTAIGDAVALAVERLHSLESRAGFATDRRIKSEVIILLTDGENNAGDIDPQTAAQMAAAFGIKVYTIGAGADARSRRGDIFSFNRTTPLDERALQSIADATGGRYFRATDTASLQEVYRRIDELERTEIEQRRYLQHTELALEPVSLGPLRLPPLLAVVFLLLAAETLLARTRFRTLP